MRGAMDWVYHHVFVLRFMRTTKKAAPLVAVGVAGLLGLGARRRSSGCERCGGARLRTAALVAVPVALAGLLVLAALPLVRGKAIDTQLQLEADRWPAWVAAGHDLDSKLPAELARDGPAGPDLRLLQVGRDARRDPAAADFETGRGALRDAVLGSARRSTCWTTVDSLVQQRRLVPGELKPLLGLMGVAARRDGHRR